MQLQQLQLDKQDKYLLVSLSIDSQDLKFMDRKEHSLCYRYQYILQG